MKYPLSPIDCQNIVEGNQQAIVVLVRRIQQSQGISHIQLPFFEPLNTQDGAHALINFLAAIGIKKLSFEERWAHREQRSVMAHLRAIDRDIRYHTRSNPSRKRVHEGPSEGSSTKLARLGNKDEVSSVHDTAYGVIRFRFGLSVGSISEEILNRITNPASINQGPLLCCGVASLTTQILMSQPAVFQDLAWELTQLGTSKTFPLPLEVDESQLRTRGTPTVAEVFMNALNNCKTYIEQLGVPLSHLNKMVMLAGDKMGLTRDPKHFQSVVLDRLYTIFANMPRQIVNLLKTFGYNVLKDTTSFTPMELLKAQVTEDAHRAGIDAITYSDAHQNLTETRLVDELQNIQEALEQQNHVMMMLDLQYNNKLIDYNDITSVDGLPRMTHYAYLSQLSYDVEADKVDLTLCTFGESHKASDTLEEFTKGYRGCIISGMQPQAADVDNSAVGADLNCP